MLKIEAIVDKYLLDDVSEDLFAQHQIPDEKVSSFSPPIDVWRMLT